ncbi:FKBP-type peptidyl-prolyl cis-trans isomerase [Larkinella rosea]|uniref:Peptidyl-prolyl cis-trans isomerase n=1 Tax=Larkinella rosea TaxID=2025312 RepID=A0A3P1BUJ8_9BACT|nr:FKBP-type peptidyl-prolyl cis-trans isomerase [Larkinella rosea]RRB04780.1 FKBP-type peptidylprolyl isomerase [Larkinella rosea]
MKKYGFILLVGVLLMGGCLSNTEQTPCDPAPISVKAPQAEVTALKQFIDSNRIAASADDRGFYYSIKAPGSGSKPTVCSTVTVNYTGKLTNGSTFDSGSGVTFGLNQLILGWQEGIPLVAPGGSITLYLPPSLAYGQQALSGIPANSILIFTIDLVGVN